MSDKESNKIVLHVSDDLQAAIDEHAAMVKRSQGINLKRPAAVKSMLYRFIKGERELEP